MDAYTRFHRLLKRDFSPLLRADGFKGSGNTFRRINEIRIDIVNIQGSVYGGKCCVNLASHFLFLLSTVGREVTVPKKLKEYECYFRDRLRETTVGDKWWDYGESEAEAEISVANLVELYKRRGGVFFDGFEPFPDVFEKVTPSQLDAGDLSSLPPLRFPNPALILARIMKHLGHEWH